MVTRAGVVQAFLDLYEKPEYLEVGVSKGTTFHAVTAARKVAVDKRFKFDTKQAAAEHAGAAYHEMTSDAYFGAAIGRDELFDVVYVDGLHTFEQTLRDFLNALEHLKPRGTIVIDDVYPISYAASMPDAAASKRLRAQLGIDKPAWMGDVYRLVWFIQTFCQSLDYLGVAENHGQLVVWRRPRPEAAIPHRTVEAIGKLPYEAAVLEQSAYAFTPLAEIVEAVKAAIEDRPAPVRATPLGLPGAGKAARLGAQALKGQRRADNAERAARKAKRQERQARQGAREAKPEEASKGSVQAMTAVKPARAPRTTKPAKG